MSLKTGFAQIFTRCPKNLSCPKFEGAGCSPPRLPPPPGPYAYGLMCFTCRLRSGFSHFINMDSLSFTWYLVAAESRISKQSGVQDALQNSELCRCLKTFEDLSESKCSRTRVEKCRLVSPT